MDDYLIQVGQKAQAAGDILRQASSQEKNQALALMAEALRADQEAILKSNQEDIRLAQSKGRSEAFIERLSLNDRRIEAMAQGLESMMSLADPLNQTIREWRNDQGLLISQRPVPLGVIGIIYESRPNVTVDATGLCLKSGNATILRGGSDAFSSNRAIVYALQKGLHTSKLPTNAIQLITNPSYAIADQLMQLTDYVDCLIPRGGGKLIQRVVDTAKVPVIETGVGNCHLYIHGAADLDKAIPILVNGKTQRVSVCNALETLLVDQTHLDNLETILAPLIEQGIEIRGDQATCQRVPQAILATPEDYATEFLDKIIAVKVVEGYDQALDHIRSYSTGHSEAIVTEDYSVAQAFMNQVDSAAVYVNASTRFTDGAMFGMGGEIGISTQKLHARGPMGLEALTSYKYVIQGKGQVRD